MPAPRLGQGRTIDLLNTVWADRHGRYDALGDLELARGWAETELTAGGVRTLRDLRDALRVLAAELTQDPRPVAEGSHERVTSAETTLNQVAALAPTWPVLRNGRLGSASDAAPEQQLLGGLAGDAVLFLASEPGLRACLAPGCVLYFVKDHPRRAWCSTACGNRERAARHYARHRN